MSRLEQIAREQRPGLTDRQYRELADEADRQIDEATDRLAGTAPPGETYSAKLARLSQARQTAEELAVADVLLAAPPPMQETDPDRTPQEPELDEAMQVYLEARQLPEAAPSSPPDQPTSTPPGTPPTPAGQPPAEPPTP